MAKTKLTQPQFRNHYISDKGLKKVSKNNN